MSCAAVDFRVFVAGEGVALRVVAGERGLMAVAILSWEAAQVE